MAASIFLSYASEDRAQARAIGDALAQFGIDVWLDESELGGGDAWDQKIRRQIRECDYFMPLVSARTEARHEGYFRREWRLAVERTLDMADDHLFLLPIVIDDTDQARARVPEKFFAVQWLRLPGGQPTPALEALCRRILSGGAPADPGTKSRGNPSSQSPSAPAADHKSSERRPARAPAAAAGADEPRAKPPYPPFPHEEPGQRVRFWAHVIGWAARCFGMLWMRLPRWLRIVLYIWLAFVVMTRGCSAPSNMSHISHSDVKKLEAMADQYRGSANPSDIAKLGSQVAKEFADSVRDEAGFHAVLAIPFGAPSGDAASEKVADAAFAQTYGQLSLTHRGQVGLDQGALASNDAVEALARARKAHATYVVYGAVRAPAAGAAAELTVNVSRVEDGSVVWTESYPTASANAAKIAEEVSSEVPDTTSKSADE